MARRKASAAAAVEPVTAAGMIRADRFKIAAFIFYKLGLVCVMVLQVVFVGYFQMFKDILTGAYIILTESAPKMANNETGENK